MTAQVGFEMEGLLTCVDAALVSSDVLAVDVVVQIAG